MEKLLLLSGLVFAQQWPDMDTPPGPYAHARTTAGCNHRAGDPLVVTTYFYWYDVTTGFHVIDPDGTDALTHHPPTLKGFSYKNVEWHARQLLDMSYAGIDVVLPVYWGTPGSPNSWSNVGLSVLVQARKKLLEAGKHVPCIGMFYDTSTLKYNPHRLHIDLSTEKGREWFFATIRDFFSLIPLSHRALVDSRLLVFLYSPAFAKTQDPNLFDWLQERCRQTLGSRLFIVKLKGWIGQADLEYMWGGALSPKFLDVAAIGPGYDHSAVPNRKPLVRDRENGRYYCGSWEELLRRPPGSRPWMVHIETWNEFHEGTEICESKEYGRTYIELTRKYTRLFHNKVQLQN